MRTPSSEAGIEHAAGREDIAQADRRLWSRQDAAATSYRGRERTLSHSLFTHLILASAGNRDDLGKQNRYGILLRTRFTIALAIYSLCLIRAIDRTLQDVAHCLIAVRNLVLQWCFISIARRLELWRHRVSTKVS